MNTTSITVAVAQAVGTADLAQNISTIERMSAEASQRGAEIVAFPEAMMFDFTSSAEDLFAVACNHGEEFENKVRSIAKKTGIAIVTGAYAKGTNALARNMMIAIDQNGETLGQYQKLHLYDAFRYKESEKNEPASLKPDFNELVTFELGGFRFGLLNCYDIRFPEMARLLIDKGADVLLVSSGWVAGPLKEFHWETLLKARAIENTCFVAASCQPAPLSVGLSMIVDPNGIPVSTVPQGDGLAISTINAERVLETRETLPCLQHRRYAVRQLG
ncbi:MULTISPECIES: carbon-nitrogen hydrolase family protein [Nitratireductor]|uniref:carbon-nitrogen hydrolase family protein n=1 Tax=Nitratireductor TaxID=245876 RepID=UPI0019D3E009|nr:MULTISPECIES: carbon-nitrogen hydrolase family protein [Nitratireductor]MBN7763012.1 carbon-nitrogen hydrolase family protein [Nitratireductor aquibiodomus]MDJ1465863.1 carbon-nitrogen hydrolase family protein [Nitratireductor sp. GZWM139]